MTDTVLGANWQSTFIKCFTYKHFYIVKISLMYLKFTKVKKARLPGYTTPLGTIVILVPANNTSESCRIQPVQLYFAAL